MPLQVSISFTARLEIICIYDGRLKKNSNPKGHLRAFQRVGEHTHFCSFLAFIIARTHVYIITHAKYDLCKKRVVNAVVTYIRL